MSGNVWSSFLTDRVYFDKNIYDICSNFSFQRKMAKWLPYTCRSPLLPFNIYFKLRVWKGWGVSPIRLDISAGILLHNDVFQNSFVCPLLICNDLIITVDEIFAFTSTFATIIETCRFPYWTLLIVSKIFFISKLYSRRTIGANIMFVVGNDMKRNLL